MDRPVYRRCQPTYNRFSYNESVQENKFISHFNERYVLGDQKTKFYFHVEKVMSTPEGDSLSGWIEMHVLSKLYKLTMVALAN
jgi:hypothetical protein